jgi:hypothetical protein
LAWLTWLGASRTGVGASIRVEAAALVGTVAFVVAALLVRDARSRKVTAVAATAARVAGSASIAERDAD